MEPFPSPTDPTGAHLPTTADFGTERPLGRHVTVVGAGVSGLVAARDLARAGYGVTVVEASERIGGQVRTIDFADRLVDVGAEAVFAAPPHLSALVRDLGLWDSALGSHVGPTLLGHPRGAQPMPAGIGPSGPTQLLPVVRSGMLSLPGMVRAGLEPFLARMTPPLPADQDIVAYCRGAYCVLSYDAVRLLHAAGRRALRLSDGMLEWRLADLPVAT